MFLPETLKKRVFVSLWKGKTCQDRRKGEGQREEVEGIRLERKER